MIWRKKWIESYYLIKKSTGEKQKGVFLNLSQKHNWGSPWRRNPNLFFRLKKCMRPVNKLHKIRFLMHHTHICLLHSQIIMLLLHLLLITILILISSIQILTMGFTHLIVQSLLLNPSIIRTLMLIHPIG